jgi:hypothetical protein
MAKDVGTQPEGPKRYLPTFTFFHADAVCEYAGMPARPLEDDGNGLVVVKWLFQT